MKAISREITAKNPSVSGVCGPPPCSGSGRPQSAVIECQSLGSGLIKYIIEQSSNHDAEFSLSEWKKGVMRK